MGQLNSQRLLAGDNAHTRLGTGENDWTILADGNNGRDDIGYFLSKKIFNRVEHSLGAEVIGKGLSAVFCLIHKCDDLAIGMGSVGLHVEASPRARSSDNGDSVFGHGQAPVTASAVQSIEPQNYSIEQLKHMPNPRQPSLRCAEP
jgi:hypothetical protein